MKEFLYKFLENIVKVSIVIIIICLWILFILSPILLVLYYDNFIWLLLYIAIIGIVLTLNDKL